MPRPTRVNSALARYPTIQISRLALCEGNSKRPVYTMHKWWARRLGAVFRMILLTERQRAEKGHSEDLWGRFYSASALPEGFTVLDPFLGGGTTLIEASKQGATCIGVDIDPVACFITEMELAPITAAKIEARYKQIAETFRKEVGKLYKTTRRGVEVDVVHYFWVDVVTCPTCRAQTDAHPTYQLVHDAVTKRQSVVCPRCDAIAEYPLTARWNHCRCGHSTDLKAPPVSKGIFTCPECESAASIASLAAEGMVVPRLFATEFLTAKGDRGFQRASDEDLARYNRASHVLAQKRRVLPLPRARIPVAGRSDRRPVLFGYRSYYELFNHRQLLGLGIIAQAIKDTRDRDTRRALALAFSHALASNNMFCGWAFGYRRLTPLFGVHAFRKVTRPVEGNLLGLEIGRGSFANAVRAVLRGYEYMAKPFEYRYDGGRPIKVPVALVHGRSANTRGNHARILNRSSTNLAPLQDKSVNLVLTDPPYFDNISYSELSDFYHVWLRVLLGEDYVGSDRPHTPIGGSLYGGKRRRLKHRFDPKKKYISTLTRVLSECRRVVRDDGALVFTFHHKSMDAWEGLGTALLNADFVIDDVVPVRSEGRSGFHSYEGTIKWDSVFFCRPGPKRIKTITEVQVSAEIARRSSALADAWTTRIRRSRFDFSAADRSSFAMSVVLQEFSDRNICTSLLQRTLARVAAAEESRQEADEIQELF